MSSSHQLWDDAPCRSLRPPFACSDAQVHQVFDIFGELVAHACRVADEDAAGGSVGGRSRMEDELMIFLRKQLSSAAGAHRRVGIIGTVALVQRLACDSQAMGAHSATGAEGGGACCCCCSAAAAADCSAPPC